MYLTLPDMGKFGKYLGRRHTTILVIVDRFTKMIREIPIKCTNALKNYASIFQTLIFRVLNSLVGHN